jgi:hypothetical protein
MPIQLQVKTVGAKLVRQGLEDFEAAIPEIGRKRIYDTMRRIRATLATPPRRPTYPIDWDSEKQRRYVMALLTRQGNIPYKPTGRYEKNWEIVKTQHGYSIENDAPFAKYASGDFRGESQSHIHEGRRPLMARVVEDEIQNLPAEIDGAISYYGRGHGLIP